MRPENHRVHLRSARIGQARMYYAAHLAWLRGYPQATADGFFWQTIPGSHSVAPEQIRVTRSVLQKAVETRKRLLAGDPRVLRQIVEDRQVWADLSAQLLDWCRATVHRGRALPDDLLAEAHAFPPAAVQRYRDLERAHLLLRPFLRAVTWQCWLRPKAFATGMRWLEGEADALVTIARHVPPSERTAHLMLLWELVSRDGPRAVRGVLRLLGDVRLWEVPLQGARRHLSVWHGRMEATRRRPRMPQPPPANAGRQLLRFLRRQRQAPERVRGRMRALFEVIFEALPLDAWESFWSRARGLRDWNQDGRMPGDPLLRRKLKRRWQGTYQARPPEVHLRQTLNLIERFAEEECEPFSRHLLPVLQALPGHANGGQVRAAMFGLVGELHERSADRSRMLLQALRSHSDALGKGWIVNFEDDLLEGWEADQPHWYGLLDRLMLKGWGPAAWKRAFGLLGTIGGRRITLSFLERELVARLARASDSVDQAFARFKALRRYHKQMSSVCGWHMQVAHALAPEDPQRFAAVAVAIGPLEHDNAMQIVALQGGLRVLGWGDLLAGLLCDGRQGDATELARLTVLVDQLGETGVLLPPSRPSTRVPAWVRGYPETFRESLLDLLHVSPKARAEADQILHGLQPDPERRQREIDVLRERLRRGGPQQLAKRIEQLERQVDAPPVLTTRAIRRYRERLDGLVRQRVITRWLTDLESRLQRSVRAAFATRSDVSVLLERNNLRAVASALGEEPATRRLALKLLARRLGPPPWLPHDHPNNERFLRSMRRRGLQMKAWLHPGGPWDVPNAGGAQAYFSEDPLEIFQMGAFFGTCLSPGDFNFFSVMANAADVNKRVLFARNAKGHVLGRCLFALTDNGRVVTFAVYRHEGGEGFADLVSDLREELARKLGTTVAAEGAVSALVAHDWYDDGVMSPHPFENLRLPPGEVRQLRPEQVAGRLEKLVAPLPLGTQTLPPLLGLPMFDARPELVLPLVDLVLVIPSWDQEELQRAVDVLLAAGADQAADRLLLERMLPILRRGDFGAYECATMLERHPAAMLRILRQTRAAGVRRDQAEPRWRRRLFAEAYTQLGRHNRAAALRV